MPKRTSFFDLRFEDSISIEASPKAGFAFFENMAANYTRWHPDHLRFEWRRGKGIAPGNAFFFEERIAGKRQRKSVRITDVQPNRSFAFEPTNPVFRYFLPHLTFDFEPVQAGFVFRATIDLHAMGPIGTRLHSREFDAVEEHMAEEGRNLKAILESGQTQ